MLADRRLSIIINKVNRYSITMATDNDSIVINKV